MDDIEALSKLFERFPGIGPRQAKRFVYFLLRADTAYRIELLNKISSLSQGVMRCMLCHRYIPKKTHDSHCLICVAPNRNKELLMVVSKDADIQAFEQAGIYNGLYFVLGGLIPLTEEVIPPKTAQYITERIQKNTSACEIIFALPVTTDGEHTRTILTLFLNELAQTTDISISTLGRGLSTGSELEYADAETLKNAFSSRKNS